VRYSVLVRRPDGGEVGHIVSTTEGEARATDMALVLAESYGQGSEVVSITDADGRNVMGEHKDPVKRESQKPDSQNKTATERVEKQTIEKKDVTPNKTGDVTPNR
jgi:hypothetical protein